MIEGIKQPYKQAVDGYIVFDEALQIKSGSALHDAATTRMVHHIQADLSKALAEAFASSKCVEVPSSKLSGVQIQLEMEEFDNNIRNHMNRWIDLIKTHEPQPSFDVTVEVSADDVLRFSGCHLDKSRKVYNVDVNYGDTTTTVNCCTEREAKYLTYVINGGGRMCKGQYQKYSKGAVSAKFLGEAYLVQITLTPTAEAITFNGKV